MLYDYKCEKCGTTQEKYHKMDEENIENCEKCGAAPCFLKKQLALVKRHGSWSRWQV